MIIFEAYYSMYLRKIIIYKLEVTKITNKRYYYRNNDYIDKDVIDKVADNPSDNMYSFSRQGVLDCIKASLQNNINKYTQTITNYTNVINNTEAYIDKNSNY